MEEIKRAELDKEYTKRELEARKKGTWYRCRNQKCQNEFSPNDTPKEAVLVACKKCGCTNVELIKYG
jgi:hypothetical protein